MIQPAANSHHYPSTGVAWLMVTVLALAYVCSFVERYFLGLLIQPIKADLHLSDEQIGYRLGPAFAIFYATVGLPLAWMADRKRRTWLVAAGVALWSLATAASGLARDFWHLFAARMSVGVGEATLSPAAMSMIGDSFPPEGRGKPIAFYSTAPTLGAGIASLLGAAVLEWTKATIPTATRFRYSKFRMKPRLAFAYCRLRTTARHGADGGHPHAARFNAATT